MMDRFLVEVKVHQGSAFSPYLFVIPMDALTADVRTQAPLSMLFAVDIVLCAESNGEAEFKLEEWRKALEERGLRISPSKTEYMRCTVSSEEVEGNAVVMQGKRSRRCRSLSTRGQ